MLLEFRGQRPRMLLKHPIRLRTSSSLFPLPQQRIQNVTTTKLRNFASRKKKLYYANIHCNYFIRRRSSILFLKVIYKNTILLGGRGKLGKGWRTFIKIFKDMILWKNSFRGINFNITSISLHFYYIPYVIASMAS